MEHRASDGSITRRKLLQNTLTVGAAVTVPGLIAACGDSGGSGTAATTGTTAAGRPVRGGNLRVVKTPVSGERLDPQAYTGAADKFRARNIFDPLAMYNQDGTVNLHLVEEFEPVRDDGTLWRIKLRSGIEFADGRPLTSNDVRYTFTRLMKPDAPYRSVVEPFLDLGNTRPVDKQTLEIALRAPIGDFGAFLANEVFMILPEGADKFEKPSDLIGTGPFRLGEFVPGQRTVLTRNDNYWENGKPYVDEVEMLGLGSETDMAGAVLAGQVDVSDGLEEAQYRRLQNNPNVKLIKYQNLDSGSFCMREDSPLFQDARVREAFKLAIDREQCLEVQYGGRGSIGNDLYGKAWPSYNDELPQREYDPEKARALLKAAGQDGIEVEVVTGLFVPAATAYAEQAKAAGIRMKVNRVPQGDVFNSDRFYLKAPFQETTWAAQKFEEVVPQTLLTSAPYNETAWKRPAWDRRFLEAFGTVDEEKRNSLYGALQEDQWREGGYIVWGYGDNFYATAPNVHGFVTPQRVGLPLNGRFENIWLDKQ